MNRLSSGGNYVILGLILVLLCIYVWTRDVIREATYLNYHTHIVARGLKLGFKLFILSEVIFFFGFFWAYFAAALAPTL